MMKLLQLPSSIVLAVLAYALAANSTPAPTPTPTPTSNTTRNATLATTGSGPEYATACWYAQMSYDQSSQSWTSAHQWISNTTQLVGGTSFSEVTYYENATTLCDGHARVTYSPAKSLSTGTITQPGTVNSTSTIVGTYFSDYPQSAPTCSIAPSDCNGLWQAYTSSLSAGNTADPPLETPPCMNQTAASNYASATKEIYGCGACTIYGEGVELVYFPTTPTSRDMCAMTPTASLTHYGPGAVITAYAGKSSADDGDFGKGTVFADGHVFTSGTAYISISTVYAVDRCSKTFGTPINDAILAMPSESVLSLRYSQDHFQRVMETDKITGYPVSYADFNTPIPWSAWNGQNICDPGGYGGWACSIIYEHSFRPQLAIPPQITQLSPEFKDCQMWYNGLWDPPLALTEAKSEVVPTPPGGFPTTTASAASGPGAPTAAPTAIPNELPTYPGGPTLPAQKSSPQPGQPTLPADVPSSSGDQPSVPEDQPSPTEGQPYLPVGGPTLPANRPSAYDPSGEPWVQSFDIGGHAQWATGANGQVHVGGATITSGGPAQTLEDGTQASYGSDGLVLKGSSTISFDDDSPSTATATADPSGTSDPSDPSDPNSSSDSSSSDGNDNGSSTDDGSDTDSVTITVDGNKVTAVQPSDGGPITVGSICTLTPRGPATTLSNGQVLSAAPSGLVIDWTSTVGKAETSESGSASGSSGDFATTTSAGNGGSGSGSDASNTASATASGDTDESTGSASNMSPAQAMSLFAALIAMVVVAG